MYPTNWPRCPKCNDYALDGHITCGRFECNEGETRRERAGWQRIDPARDATAIRIGGNVNATEPKAGPTE